VSLDATHACVVDLDGVVWLAGEALPGATTGVDELRRRGVPILFATNNATPTIDELRARLRAIGIHAAVAEIATSAQSAAALVEPGQRVHAVGEAGLFEALEERGTTRSDAAPDAVVVGLTRSFDYDACDRAACLVRGGARFIATNLDPTLPTPTGLRPGAGAIVAAIATAAGRQPEVAGKPSAAMVRYVEDRVRAGAVVGDRPSTDGALAAALGVPFALIASAVDEAAPERAVRAATLHEAVLALCA
jgi:HAD superfamily hydrolase (TIGR01450 family)